MVGNERILSRQENEVSKFSFPFPQIDLEKIFNPLMEADYKKRNLGNRKAELKPKAYHSDKNTSTGSNKLLLLPVLTILICRTLIFLFFSFFSFFFNYRTSHLGYFLK